MTTIQAEAKLELIDEIANLVMDNLVREPGYTDDDIDTWEDDAIYTQVHRLASQMYDDTLDEMACLESYLDKKRNDKTINTIDQMDRPQRPLVL